MIVHHADQLIEMKGNVIVLIHNVAQSNLHLPLETTPQGNTPESIRIQADEGMFDQEKSEADFKGHTIVIWQAWNIQSNQIHIGFDPVSKQMQSAIAEGQVVMKQNDFNATGATLTYSAEQSIIKLTGSETEKARVWRGERGSEAEQITFFVNEHRYQIEDGLSVVMPGELTESIK